MGKGLSINMVDLLIKIKKNNLSLPAYFKKENLRGEF
tara:strand:+ start:306 stop:416 length:111 start_codon:yes stop_codon:yes gene_type:complete